MKAKIYSTDWCGWCQQAKEAFEQLNYEYEEILLNTDKNIEAFKKDCPGLTSVPQIFIDNKFIGGYTELMEYIYKNL